MPLKPAKALGVIFLLIVLSITASAQCKLEHTVRVEQPQDNAARGKIFLTLKNSSADLHLKLYRIGKSFDLVEERNETGRSLNSGKPAFADLAPGTYLIQATWRDCKLTIGGVEGILVNQPRN